MYPIQLPDEAALRLNMLTVELFVLGGCAFFVFFEHAVKGSQTSESGTHGDFRDRYIRLDEQFLGQHDALLVQIGGEGDARELLEHADEMILAETGFAGCIVGADVLGAMLADVAAYAVEAFDVPQPFRGVGLGKSALFG